MPRLDQGILPAESDGPVKPGHDDRGAERAPYFATTSAMSGASMAFMPMML